MKERNKAKIGFSRISPTDLVEKGRLHVTSCMGNPDLQLPPDLLTSLASACDALELANIAVRENGGRQDRYIRSARTWDLQMLLRQLAGWVQAQYGENGEKIAAAGFELHKAPRPVGILEAPQELRARRGKLAGEVRLNWRGVKGRACYDVEINLGNLEDPEAWTPLTSTSKNYHTVTGLEPDRSYFFRVRAVGTAGNGRLSVLAMSKAA
ncbi:MAG: fibronectin type III domain-containing protein [Flavobacteriales bacterium]